MLLKMKREVESRLITDGWVCEVREKMKEEEHSQLYMAMAKTEGLKKF